MAPIVTSEEDDVSSYGVDEDRLLSPATNKPDEEEDQQVPVDPIPFRPPGRSGRRAFFADEARGATTNTAVAPPRQLPSKSPRSRNQEASRKSPAKKSPVRSRAASPPRETRREEDTAPHGPTHDNDDDDDGDSLTQDPTASVNQQGGASAASTPTDKRRSRREATPPPKGRSQRSPKRASPSSVDSRKRRRTPRTDADDLWNDTSDVGPAAPKRRTYRDWTVDETKAVIEGYALFGKKWNMIKQNCRNRLSRRTNVQIKDKWRTLVRAGEIQEDVEV